MVDLTRAVGAPVVWWPFTWAFDPGYAAPGLWPSNIPFSAGGKGWDMEKWKRGRRAIFDKTSQPQGQGRWKSVPPSPWGWGRVSVICCAWPGKWLAEGKERDRVSAGKSLAPPSAFTMVISSLQGRLVQLQFRSPSRSLIGETQPNFLPASERPKRPN